MLLGDLDSWQSDNHLVLRQGMGDFVEHLAIS